MNPVTGTRSTMPTIPEHSHEKTFLVRGGNRVKLRVKTWMPNKVYIVCDEGPDMVTDGKLDRIRKGSILISNRKMGTEVEPLFVSYDDGLYDALRGQGSHVGDGYDEEWKYLGVARGSLAWALQMSWTLTKNASPEQVARYQAHIDRARIVGRLDSAKDKLKVEAAEKIPNARRPTDRRDRVNFSSKSAVDWAIDHRLEGRVNAGRDIRSHLDPRTWSLVSLADALWHLFNDANRDIDQALTWWTPGKKFTADVARRKADTLERAAHDLEGVSVAPFSRRGFPRTATDVRQAVGLLRSDDFRRANRPLERARRSMLITTMRGNLEEVLTVVSRADKGHLDVGVEDQRGLRFVIENVYFAFFADGSPIDSDFANPVMDARVRAPLRRASELALAEPANFHDLYEVLVEACDPL